MRPLLSLSVRYRGFRSVSRTGPRQLYEAGQNFGHGTTSACLACISHELMARRASQRARDSGLRGRYCFGSYSARLEC